MNAEELRARLEQLTKGVDLDLNTSFDQLPAVKDAFTLPNTELLVVPHPANLATVADCRIELIGSLYVPEPDGQREVLQFHRILEVEECSAIHRWLRVAPEFRGVGISSAFLLRSFELYRELGITHVELEAAMETGPWHWARVGFDFLNAKERERVRGWALEVCELLEVEGPKPETFTNATQFARMAPRRSVCLEELANSLPARRGELEKIAAKNFLTMDEPIQLGRLVMLSAKAWTGYLDLEGPGYALFKAYADSKAEESAKKLLGQTAI